MEPERRALQLREPARACTSFLTLQKGYIATHVLEEWERGEGRSWDTVMSSGHLVTLVQPERLRDGEKPQASGRVLFPALI